MTDAPGTETVPAELSRRAFWAIAAAVAIFATIASYRLVDDPDFHWHLKTGEWIVEHRAVPAVDSFSFTFFGKPFRVVDWGGAVALAMLHRTAGMAGVLSLTALLAGLAMLVGAALMRQGRRHPSALLLAVSLMLVYALCAGRMMPRPQTFLYPLLGLEIWLFARAAEPGRLRVLWALPPLLVLWANLHASSFIGLAFAGAFGAGYAFTHRRRWRLLVGRQGLEVAAFAVAALIASWLAPNPLARLSAVQNIFSHSYVSQYISEWQAAPPSILLGPAGLLAAFTLVGLLANRRAVAAWEVVLVVLATWLAVRSQRFLSIGALVAGPIAYRHLAAALAARLEQRALSSWAQRLDRGAAPALVAAAALIAFGLDHATPWFGHARRPRASLIERHYPVGATRFIARERPAGNMYNTYHFGAYLLYQLGPEVKVFIDGRTGNVYDDKHMVDGVMNIKRTWPEVFARWRIEYAVTQHGELGEPLAADPRWTLVYFDDVAELYVHNRGPNAALAARLGYRAIKPPFTVDMGAPREQLLAVAAEADRAVAAAPDSAMAHSLRARARLALGEPAAFERDMRAATRLDPEFVEPWFRLGVWHLVEGRADLARGELGQAVRLAPRARELREALALACLRLGDVSGAREAAAPLATPDQDVEQLLIAISDSPMGRQVRTRR